MAVMLAANTGTAIIGPIEINWQFMTQMAILSMNLQTYKKTVITDGFWQENDCNLFPNINRANFQKCTDRYGHQWSQ